VTAAKRAIERSRKETICVNKHTQTLVVVDGPPTSGKNSFLQPIALKNRHPAFPVSSSAFNKLEGISESS